MGSAGKLAAETVIQDLKSRWRNSVHTYLCWVQQIVHRSQEKIKMNKLQCTSSLVGVGVGWEVGKKVPYNLEIAFYKINILWQNEILFSIESNWFLLRCRDLFYMRVENKNREKIMFAKIHFSGNSKRQLRLLWREIYGQQLINLHLAPNQSKLRC